MHNVSYRLVGDQLHIQVDLSQQAVDAAPVSSTGLTRLVATTRGPRLARRVGSKRLSLSLNVTTR
jgi:hypothetical protein